MSKNLETRLASYLKNAICEYNLIFSGDRILLAFSGGKDSFCLFKLLHKVFIEDRYFNASPIFYPVLIDLGFSSSIYNKNLSLAQDYILKHGSMLYIEKTDIFRKSHLPENTKNPCFLCSRMRRKSLYEIAEKFNCSKIAMAHHKDDIIETLLLNIFFSREISTMIPRQTTFGGRFEIIRPLALIEEKYLHKYSLKNSFPVIETLCLEKDKSKRKFIKDLLLTLENEEPMIRHNIFQSMKNVKTDFLLSKNKI